MGQLLFVIGVGGIQVNLSFMQQYKSSENKLVQNYPMKLLMCKTHQIARLYVTFIVTFIAEI